MKISRIMVAMLTATAMVTACSSSGKGSETAAVSPAAAEKPAAPVFSGDSAFRYVADQVAMGPRVPGSAPHEQCIAYITGRLSKAGAVVQIQDTMFAPAGQDPQRVKNIIADFNPDARRRIMLVAHYDTRPWADRDDDPSARSTPIDGANDGASGVGVMLEIARLASQMPPSTGLTMLFVDREDSGSYDGDDNTWCIGSQAYAASLDPAAPRPAFAILLDMVGGRGARFNPEYFSQRYAPAVVNRVWDAAQTLGYGDRFPRTPGGAVNDDHIHLIAAGIPAIDIIESANPETGSFNPSWHTLDDNIDNIDPLTLKIVGDVVIKTILN